MRNPRFNAFIGSPGSGKTTYINRCIQQYSGNVLLLKLWINIDDEATRWMPLMTLEQVERALKFGEKVVARIALTKKDYLPILKWVNQKYRNGLLIVDDASVFEKDSLTEQMEDLLIMRRHLGLDIWMVYHGFTGFPIEQYKFLNFLMVFNTNDNPDYKKNKIPRFDEIIAATTESQNRFKKYAYTDPRRYKPSIVKLSE